MKNWCFAAALALPATGAKAVDIDQRQLQCLAHIVYGEALGESDEAQLIVAHSAINRARLGLAKYGGSDLCGVAYKTAVSKGGKVVWQYEGAKVKVGQSKRELEQWERAAYHAYLAFQGEGQPREYITHFCSILVSWNACAWHDKNVIRVGANGGHMFYVDPEFAHYGQTEPVLYR